MTKNIKEQEFTITPDDLMKAIEMYLRVTYKDTFPKGESRADMTFQDDGNIKIVVTSEIIPGLVV